MSQPMQIQLINVKEWLSREAAPLITPLRDKADNLLNEVEERVDDTAQSSQKILENSESEMNKNNPKTYRFARNANKFAQNLTETIQTITIPENRNYEKLQTFCGDLEKSFASLTQLRAGAYPYISPYFIFDRKRLDASLKRLYDIIKELRNFLTNKYAVAKTVDDTYSLVDKLLQTINDAKQSQENRKQAEEKAMTLEKEIIETRQKIEQIQTKAELNELAKLNQAIEELREEVKHSLRHLQKPFLKLQSLTKTSVVAIPLDEVNKLSDYLHDPFMALATEENGYPTLKSVLKKLHSTISQNKLKLKSTRLRKAQDQINNILSNDSLNELQKNCKDVLSQNQRFSVSETVRELQSQLTQFQNTMKDLQRENEFLRSKSRALKDEQKKLQERTNYLRRELEKNISQLTKKNVQVVWTAA